MPEGDVLRRTAAGLTRALQDSVLQRVELRWATLDGTVLLGARVTAIEAYGKHLLLRTDNGWTLRSHLRMDGSWRIAQTGSKEDWRWSRSPNTRAVLGNGQWTCFGVLLGMLDLVRSNVEQQLLTQLGPDVMAESFPTSGLQLTLSRLRALPPQTPVCEALLDQHVQAGLGTIYTAEPLFEEGLYPWTPISEVSDDQYVRLLNFASMIMWRVVRVGFSARINRVHDRVRKPCPRCGAPIQRGLARRPPMERPIFWCAVCQAPPT